MIPHPLFVFGGYLVKWIELRHKNLSFNGLFMACHLLRDKTER